MRSAVGFSLIALLLGSFEQANAQVSRYPATVNPVLGAPYTLFMSDYTEPGSNQLIATVLFNDFNELLPTFDN